MNFWTVFEKYQQKIQFTQTLLCDKINIQKGCENMKVKNYSIVYENPFPQLRSRQSAFPFVCELKNGDLAVVYCIGEAFESVDNIVYISFSKDEGATWSEPRQMLDFSREGMPISNCAKAVSLPDGRMVAVGYAFYRGNPELPLGNPETGGLLDDFVFWSVSEDDGKTWSEPEKIECAWGHHVEASAPITVLADGTWITPITGFPDWEGKSHGRMCGRALRSEDEGKTWNDDSVCMEFDGDNVTCYEQRFCQLESGTIINIGWNENVETGERYENHYTASFDNGRTWTKPQSTGIMGQASSVCAIGGEKLLALHAIRRDTDRPGIYGCIVDFSEKKWNIIEKTLIWEPLTPMVKDKNMAEIFSFLKFGQPGAIRLSDGDVMMSHWFAEQGQYSVMTTRIEL